jgi:hypothetical protein
LPTYRAATVPGFPNKIWYDSRAMTNIFAFHEMEKYNRVTYASNKEKAFVVQMENGKEIRVEKSPSGLYYYQPRKLFNTNKHETTMIDVVEGKKSSQSNKLLKRTKPENSTMHAIPIHSRLQDYYQLEFH